ncbi:hypothetical protein M422DRAFT_166272 [Sphaerobolus stellatus SS14]|uniref:Unplaced genomic scaffold SPHSTscaffold_36, whole genome shotgun sequence n=1 Tax=Sphaerobolus stellatus (strain SS14) TaxID=990650 RepID=A0A0C9URT1_SPHS4|nr:hypothetical protein M422DRAFT_166272 [Sphaerobolus stellatus SS14]
MDIFSPRGPSIAEDTLSYSLALPPSFEADAKAEVAALATVISSFVSSTLAEATSSSSSSQEQGNGNGKAKFIWHRDAFELKVQESKGKGKSKEKGGEGEAWRLEGRMRVGDCVDDEWAVVWVLREASRRWDVCVSVYDSDGEFLLIEAAEYLPEWITPENSDNRVWIYQGNLHIVPLQFVSAPSTKRERRRTHDFGGDSDNEFDESGGADNMDMESDYISYEDAVKIVRNPKVDTLAPKEVEKAAFRRIEGYPAAARQHVHRTKVYLPKDIALALQKNPSLVQKAVETFYTRDAIQMRATRMARFTPEPSVLTTVTMTRTAYAQLVGQKFHPPRIFGQWKEKEGTPEWRRKDLGMKIACGFEMVYQESKNRHEQGISNTEASLEARKEALRRDTEYTQYIGKLQQVGFFRGELEGSAAWRGLETEATSQFIQRRQIDNANRSSFALLVNSAITDAQQQVGTDGVDVDFAKEEEDSDEWLNVTESMMESILNQAKGQGQPSASTLGIKEVYEMDVDEDPEKIAEKKAAEQASELKNLAEKVEKFVEGKGDVQGATFEDEMLSDEEEEDPSEFSDDSDNESKSDTEEQNQSMNTEPTDTERQAAMEKLVPALDPSEYGQMPSSFHTNSQTVRENLPTRPENEDSESKDRSLTSASDATKTKPIRPLIFPRDEFDGYVDSDDESEIAEEDAEDEPMVVGDVEIDMNEEEEEFLKFSREALGISSDMWNEIVEDRKQRGAFLPKSAFKKEKPEETAPIKTGSASSVQGVSVPAPPEPKVKDNTLDSFEAVMQAMDAELARIKQGAPTQKRGTVPPAKPSLTQDKGKQKATVESNEDEDEVDAMEAEFRAAIKDDIDDEKGPLDYTLMKNFLESFKSQEGMSGPVGNLIGRLGGQLPRDES